MRIRGGPAAGAACRHIGRQDGQGRQHPSAGRRRGRGGETGLTLAPVSGTGLRPSLGVMRRPALRGLRAPAVAPLAAQGLGPSPLVRSRVRNALRLAGPPPRPAAGIEPLRAQRGVAEIEFAGSPPESWCRRQACGRTVAGSRAFRCRGGSILCESRGSQPPPRFGGAEGRNPALHSDMNQLAADSEASQIRLQEEWRK